MRQQSGEERAVRRASVKGTVDVPPSDIFVYSLTFIIIMITFFVFFVFCNAN